jgi:primosomal protein N' (replication factor Y)
MDDDVRGRRIVRVAFESAADTEFDYLVPDEIWPVKVGQRVEAPFGRKNKLQKGFCVEADVASEDAFGSEQRGIRLKTIDHVVDKEPLIDLELMALARWISGYYFCPLGQVLAAMVPAAVKKGAGVKTQKYVYLITPADRADAAIEELRGNKQKAIVTFLREQKAFGPESAVDQSQVLKAADCTHEPLKRLARRRIVKIGQKTILKSLPAIPKSAAVRTEQQIILNDDQRRALDSIKSVMDSKQFGVSLIHGVTDSGKTELYIRAIQDILLKDKTAIVLLPEIALTAQTVQRFSERFENIAVMHSALTGAQRNLQWQKIKSGEADVVIGARSAVFAPLSNLGLIVVDEEHEPSYKQDTAPRYNGRDVAIKRAQLANAQCILGSATPSLEMLENCRSKEYFTLLRLPKRVMDLPMPRMKLVDLTQSGITNKGMNLISEPLTRHLKGVLGNKEQAILLLNRRGYSNLIFCPSCRHTLRCRNCDVTLTFHKSKKPRYERMRTVTGKHMNYGYAICHYCLARTLVPERCPLCGKGFAMIGLGSQRLEEELARKFPEARVARIDSDAMASKDYYRLLADFGEGRIDILAGTQMLAKGLHFPNVTLVGIISADTCLYVPDFRANERTFQLISQVAGRTGRSEKKGTVYVQTFLANQPAIRFAVDGDFNGFVKQELRHRRACNLPPFWRLARLVLRDMKFDKLEAACRQMRQRIDTVIARDGLKAKVRGPMPAVISRMQRFHRMQIIVQAPEPATVQRLFAGLRAERPIRPAVKVAIDIDPIHLL